MSEHDVDPDGAGAPSGTDAPIDDVGDAPAPADVVEELDVEQLVAQRDEFREAAQRVQADFENYRKRVLREQTENVARATEGLVEQLLPVLDSFELALDTLDEQDERVRKGIELVYAQLLSALERVGLERIDTDGKPFDPNVHEAVMHEEGDGDPVVAETMRGGYRLKGRVLRPAMVKVAR
jgi:molecular chaperone GrpE